MIDIDVTLSPERGQKLRHQTPARDRQVRQMVAAQSPTTLMTLRRI